MGGTASGGNVIDVMRLISLSDTIQGLVKMHSDREPQCLECCGCGHAIYLPSLNLFNLFLAIIRIILVNKQRFSHFLIRIMNGLQYSSQNEANGVVNC